MDYVQIEIKSDQLSEPGYQFHTSEEVIQDLGAGQCDLKHFQSFWNSLPTDPFMADGGLYRERRFGVFHYIPGSGLTFKGNEKFFQSKDVNTLNGGVDRSFECIESEFASDPVLMALLYRDINQLPLNLRFEKLKVYIHQIRILSCLSMKGRPTPEGIHQDGHLFVAQHLVNRTNVSGGMSQIYDLNKYPLFEKILMRPLDTLLVNDPFVFHSVTPITSFNGIGSRDMLLVDFNFLEEV